MNTKQEDKIDWREIKEYARAVREGRIPQEILDQSEITYRKPGLLGTQIIPLPKDLRIKEAMAAATPRKRMLLRATIGRGAKAKL